MQVPKGYCQCGCGQKVKEGCRFIHGHNRRGIHHSFSIQSRKRMSVGQLNRFSNPENHPRWKGGEIRHRGYTWIRAIGHPRANRHGYVKRAFLVVEDILGLIVPHEQELHHINQDKTDDRLINLAMLSHAEHSKLHGKLRGGLNYARI